MAVDRRGAAQRTLFDHEHEDYRESFRSSSRPRSPPTTTSGSRRSSSPASCSRRWPATASSRWRSRSPTAGRASTTGASTSCSWRRRRTPAAATRSAARCCTPTSCIPYLMASAPTSRRTLVPVGRLGREDPRHRDDRAGHGLRPRRHQDAGRRDNGDYVLNGAKTFITNGINADLVDRRGAHRPTTEHGGLSLFLVERGMDGFERGAQIEKVGQHASGHRRAVLRRRARAGREPARREGRASCSSCRSSRPSA